jgi:hypothetical protein
MILAILLEKNCRSPSLPDKPIAPFCLAINLIFANFEIKVDTLGSNINMPENSMFRFGNGILLIGKPSLLYKTVDTLNVNNKTQGLGKYDGLICKWSNLKPGDEVGIVFNW